MIAGRLLIEWLFDPTPNNHPEVVAKATPKRQRRNTIPFMKNGKRDYKKEREWEKENGDKRNKDRAGRNKARREAGLKVGDPREADHKKPLSEGGSNKKSNIQVVSRKANADKEARRKRKKPGNN